MRRRLFLIAALLLGPALASCSGSRAARPVAREADETAPAALVVRRGAFRERFVLTGELEAVRATEIAVPRNPSWETTIRWMETDGATVRAGAPVVEFDSSAFVSDLEDKKLNRAQAMSDLEEREAQITADVADKEFQVEQRRAALEKAKKDASIPEELLDRRKYQEYRLALKRAEFEHEKALEDLDAARLSTAEDLEQRRIALEKAEREIAAAEKAIEEMTLRAPRDGILVVAEHPWEGRKLQIGDNVWVGIAVARIPELDQMRIDADLFDVDDGRITTGMPIVAYLDTYPTIPFPGRIVEITPVAQEPEMRTLRRAFRVKADLDKADPERMRPGMSVRVEVETVRREGVLLAPRAALDLAADPPQARRDSGEMVDVKLGMCNTLECIVEGGLEEGQRLRGGG